MQLKEILKDIELKSVSGDLDAEITGICYDSRAVRPGNLFVAVRGYESDGHKFIASAVQNGAACVLCEEPPETDVPYVVLEDTRRGLALASANWFGRPADKMKIIGVTGTNGKTTVTNLVKTIIEELTGDKVGLIGTNNNLIGDEVVPTERTTPESYDLQALFAQMYEKGCKYVVMEVSSHALYLDRVCGITFEVGAFTNLTPDHLDFHKTMEAYGLAKAKLFTQCRAAIVNFDDPYGQMMIDHATCPVHTISACCDDADLSARNIVLKADGVSFCALAIGILEKVFLGIPGQFSVYNALTAMGICLCLGLDISKIAAALSDCKGVKGRVEVVPTGRDFTMLIDYAHTPDALENVLKTVRGFAPGRVVILFGCGGDRDKTKRPVMGKIAVDLADFAIITSDNPRTEEPSAILADILEGVTGTKTPYVVIENRREAIGWAIEHAQKDDVVILAGKGHETYQIIGHEKRHFDEREVVAEFLR